MVSFNDSQKGIGACPLIVHCFIFNMYLKSNIKRRCTKKCVHCIVKGIIKSISDLFRNMQQKSIVFPSLSTGAGMTGNAMSASAANPIVTGKARVTPTANANGTSAAGAALEGGATAAAAAGAAAGGRAETGEVRKLHAGINCTSAGTHVGESCWNLTGELDVTAVSHICKELLEGTMWTALHSYPKGADNMGWNWSYCFQG